MPATAKIVKLKNLAKIDAFVIWIAKFAKKNKLSQKDSFLYLSKYGGIDFLEEDFLDDTVYENIDDLKNELLEYMIYYSEHRQHSAINGKKPLLGLYNYEHISGLKLINWL